MERLFIWLVVLVFRSVFAVMRWLGLPGTSDVNANIARVGATRGVLRFAATVIAFFGLAALLPQEAEGRKPRQDTPSEDTLLPELALPAVGTKFDVGVSDVTTVLRDFSSRDVADQIRDWAVLGTLARLELPAPTVARATVGVVPVRFPYLEEMFPFEYGRGRKAIIDTAKGPRALLFYEASEPDPVATLGRLVDRVHMELGELPPMLDVFAFEPALADGSIRVERKPSLTREQLLSAQYGYFEASVDSLPDFEQWLKQIDDVVWASDEDGRLRLGGRRFKETRERGVSLEDVSVLYRAQVGAAAEKRELDAALKALEAKYKTMPVSSDAELKSLQASFDADAEQLIRTRGGEHEPGFSLDPHWRPDTLKPAVDLLAKDFCRGAQALIGPQFSAKKVEKLSEPTLTQQSELRLQKVLDGLTRWGLRQPVCREAQRASQTLLLGLSAELDERAGETPSARMERIDAAAAPLLAMAETAGSSEAIRIVLSEVGELLRAKHQVQCARYDGPTDPLRSLQGTRVGMNLFYTDLLAKLWVALDYHHSAPSLAIAGFMSQPQMDIEPYWTPERNRLNSTRLWFGPKREASTRSPDGHWLAFKHIATRVFAAGSNPTNPKQEEQPNEVARRSFGWWDRHYEEVAVYEPEYSLQNQIMKWSVLTEWLVAQGRAHYLDAIPDLDHPNYQFDQWHEHQQQALGLTYQRALTLRPKAEWLAGTECMDLLTSRSFESGGDSRIISGGVSLAGERAAASAPRIVTSESASLRFMKSLVSNPVEVEVGVGTSIKVIPEYRGAGRVVASGTDAARMRWRGANLDVGHTLETRVVPLARGTLTDVVAADKGSLGWFSARTRDGNVALDWTPSELHARVQPMAAAKPAAFDPLSEFGDPELLRKLDDAAGHDPWKAAKLFDEKRASALADARKALAEGDLTRAAAHFRAGDLAAPELALDRGLLELEQGAIARGRSMFAALDPMQLRKIDTPWLHQLRELGVNDEQLTDLLQGKRADWGDRSLELVAEPGRPTVMLRYERALRGRIVPLEERADYVRKLGSDRLEDHDFHVYLADAYSLNQQDMAMMGDGALADFASSPEVKWTAVDDIGHDFAPELLVVEDVRYRRVSAPRRAVDAEAAARSSRIVFVQPSPQRTECDRRVRDDCPG